MRKKKAKPHLAEVLDLHAGTAADVSSGCENFLSRLKEGAYGQLKTAVLFTVNSDDEVTGFVWGHNSRLSTLGLVSYGAHLISSSGPGPEDE